MEGRVGEMLATVESLSAEQRELLRAAAGNQGNLSLFRRSDTKGPAVHVKHKAFFDKNDPGVAARYVEALRQLVELLFMRSRTSEQFELTNHGWQISGKVGK
jgi:hypothetical protein